jgi:ribonuclease-3
MGLAQFIRSLLGQSTIPDPPVADVEVVEDIIGYHFRNPELLHLALSHRSYVRNNHLNHSNERLEFLGDSVLGLIIAERLFVDNPDMSEGELTKTKAMLVNEVTLSAIGLQVGLNDCILMSPEEERSGGRERSSIIADAVESVIAAVFVDGGVDAVPGGGRAAL